MGVNITPTAVKLLQDGTIMKIYLIGAVTEARNYQKIHLIRKLMIIVLMK